LLLLLAFALVAGVGTAFSPCVLPVLPVALSAGASGGRRRPLGVATGLAVSHTFALVLLVYLLAALGLPDDLFRTLAIAVLLVFGLSLLVPVVSGRIEAYLSRFTRRPDAPRGDGFWSGVALGTGLGFVYAPCAGPILAGVVTVSASQEFTGGRLAVALAYGIGSAIGIYALMLGGRRLSRRLAPRSGRFQQALGAVMVVMAALLFADVDTRFQTAVASDLPSFLVNPTEQLEDEVRDESAQLRGGRVAPEGGAEEAAAGADLPVLGVAPDFIPGGRWFNSQPLSLERLRGRVVLVDFWTYTCINCIRTLPYLKAWDERYRDRGLTIVGVHTPEFAFEKEAGNVRDAIEQNGLRYPVVQDNDFATWNAYGNQFWPAKYLIDAQGHVRFTHFGEGEYEATEQAIRALLAEAGEERLGRQARARVDAPSPGVTTPETYLGSLRAQGWETPIFDGRRTYPPLGRELREDSFALEGEWTIDGESATAGRGAAIVGSVGTRRVFLVMDGHGRSRDVRVLLDGKPLPDRFAGEDVRGGRVRVREQRLYRLVDLPEVGRHELRLELAPGVSGFAFTFG
jgi:cytochrome c biogenesis protein CcdA/thiol-disulfide isomerase/thioredoxin